MALLTSRLERDETFARRAERMEALVAELRERTALVSRGGGEKAVERHRSRGKLTARERIDRLLDPGTAFLELNALAAWELYDGSSPVGRDRDGDRRRRGSGVRGRRERRDRQGRLLLPAHGQEALAGTGGRRAEQPSVHLPRRLRRRLPAPPGGGLPRPRALRADLLQPGADVREGDSPDRDRDGVVHRRGRLRAGNERRDGDRPGHGNDLHRRAAAREGCDRPGRHRRGVGRRRRAYPPFRRRRPLRDLRRARARTGPTDRPQPPPPQGAARGTSRRPSRPRSTRTTSTGSFPRTSSTSSMRTR